MITVRYRLAGCSSDLLQDFSDEEHYRRWRERWKDSVRILEETRQQHWANQMPWWCEAGA